METARVTLYTYFNISDTKFIILENGDSTSLCAIFETNAKLNKTA